MNDKDAMKQLAGRGYVVKISVRIKRVNEFKALKDSGFLLLASRSLANALQFDVKREGLRAVLVKVANGYRVYRINEARN